MIRTRIEKVREVAREKVFEPLDEFQEKARQQWLSLNQRERVIVSALASVMALLIFALVIKEVAGFFYASEHMAENNVKNISRIQKLVGDLNDQKSEMLRFERLKTKRGDDFDLTKYLEAEAGRSGVALAKISPTKSKASGGPEEEWVEVQLGPDSTLMPTLQFLQNIDETLGLRLVELSLKPQFADPTKLSVTAVVANNKTL